MIYVIIGGMMLYIINCIIGNKIEDLEYRIKKLEEK